MKAEVVRIILWSLVRAQHGLPHFTGVPPRRPGRMHPRRFRAVGTPASRRVFLFLPAAKLALSSSVRPSVSFAVPVLTGFHHPGRDVPFRAGRYLWNPETVQGGAEDPWRGQGLCRESPQAGVSLAYFVLIFCPRIAGCRADIPRNRCREDTMIIPDRGISSIFFFSRFASGQKSRILHRWNITLGVLLFQEYSLQWPH